MWQQTVPTSRGERNKGVARRFLARGWVPVQFGASGFRRAARRLLVRGWVRCTIRCLRIPTGGTAIPLPEAGFAQSRRASPEAHQSRSNLPVSRCRFLPGPIEGAARATAGSKDEELAHGDVLALPDEPTCRLPASGWGFFLQHRFVDISPDHRGFQELFPPGDAPAERTLANSRQKVRRD